MDILTQFNSFEQDTFKIDSLLKILKDIIYPNENDGSKHFYGQTMSSFSSWISNFAKRILVSAFEKADSEFRYSPGRTKYYYVKQTRSRSLITVFGYITFTRTEYIERESGRPFIYVDRKLGIEKRQVYDAAVRSMIVNEYSNHNSMIKVGKIVGERIFSAYSLDKNRDKERISRQQVHRILKEHQIKYPVPKSEETPETIYIMADEKWIPLQGEVKPEDNPNKPIKKMQKVACVFSDRQLEYKGRYMLIDKFYFTSEGNFWEECYDALLKRYDFTKIKQVIILGDGASWIRNGASVFKTCDVDSFFALDKFHLGQAIQRIFKNKDMYATALDYIVNNRKKDFDELVEEELKDEKKNKDTIKKNYEYIKNNWHYIQNAFHKVENMSCAMEQVISHVIASTFTSVPKAYSRANLPTYVTNRIAVFNHIDIMDAYLRALDSKKNNETVIDLGKEEYDWSIFELTNEGIKSSLNKYINYGLKNS